MLALYRKYRPTTLKGVISQSQVTTPLQNALSSGKISHSYLFTGPRGCGKTSVARIFAHEINHFPYEIEDSYLDIIEIDAASNTGVDNIRELREKAAIAPSKGQYKVYIIDEVHMLSKSAFNALLKTLEEPPAHVVFILATTDPDKVPVTITSRSQVFKFRLAPSAEMLPYLQQICQQEQINISAPALEIITKRGGGSFRDTLTILDQISTLTTTQTAKSTSQNQATEISAELVSSVLGLPLDSQISALLSAYAENDPEQITAQLKALLQDGFKPEQIAASALDQIIQTPSSELLPLLASLPSVSAPFPEAKLLLAFLASLSDLSSLSERQTCNFRRYAQATAELKLPNPVTTGAKTAAAEGPVSASEPMSVRKSGQTPNTPTNLKDFFDSIRTINPAIYQQVEKCVKKQEGNVLHLYPTKKITHTILSRPGNSAILSANLPAGLSLELHTTEDYIALQSDPTISQVSSIMGGAQPLSPSDSPF